MAEHRITGNTDPQPDVALAARGRPGERAGEDALAELDGGSRELVAGYLASLDVRARIRLAVEVKRAVHGVVPLSRRRARGACRR